MSETFNFSSLLAAKNAVELLYGDMAKCLKMSQSTFNDLYDTALKDVEGVEIDETKDRPYDPSATVYGIRIKIDNRMKNGAWRFEK